MRLIDRFFGWSLVGLAAAELLSALTFFQPMWHSAVTLLLAAGVLAATIRQLRFGLYAIVADLFLSGKGYWFSLPLGGDRLPLRMLLFGIVFAVWFSGLIRNRRLALPPKSSQRWLPALTAAAVGMAVIQGLLRSPFDRTFLDANAWIFFLLLPAFLTALNNARARQRVVQLLLAAVTVMALKTMLTLWAFGHLPPPALEPWYRIIRSSGVGEITPINGPLVRVFFQSHVYALVAAILLLTLLCRRALRHPADTAGAAAVWYLATATLIISQSRSFWVAGLAATALVLSWAAFRYGLRWRVLAVALLLAIVVQSQQSLVSLISGNYGDGLLTRRLSGLGSEAAASTRRNQLKPLLAAIGEHPVFGSGFGRTVTYRSQDPRILKQHPDGWYTTAAFEWGYLDIALKLGGLGLFAYGLWIATIALAPFRQKKISPDDTGDEAGIGEGIALSLVAIAIAHIFTPYLNHPLGIGWVLVAAANAARSAQTAGDPAATRRPLPPPFPQLAADELPARHYPQTPPTYRQ